MTKNTPSLKEWRQLYDIAVQIKQAAPWEWMEETDLFGVQNPETKELGFASVMGTLGEHYAVAVYLGAKGLHGFWSMQEAGPHISPEQFFEIPQMQASFEDRNELSQKDRKLIKKLGLKFRGRQAWPMFRSYRPGYVPWYLEAAEARFLTHVLTQTLDVALRFEDDPALLEPPDDETYLVRVAQAEAGSLTWSDQLMTVPPPEPAPISLQMDVQALAQLKQAPPSGHILEIDFFLMPAAIQEQKEERPYYPYVLLVVEAQSSFILGTEMLSPEPSLEAMWGLVPMYVVQLMAQAGLRPRQVNVRSALLQDLLQPVAEELQFKLNQSRRLPGLDEAKEFMFQRFM